MNSRIFISLNLLLAGAIIVALAFIPRTATVSDAQFFLLCGSIFACFYVLPFLAKMGFKKALLWATICSCSTLFAAAAIAAFVHEVLERR
jgi:hypothetical protein